MTDSLLYLLIVFIFNINNYAVKSCYLNKRVYHVDTNLSIKRIKPIECRRSSSYRADGQSLLSRAAGSRRRTTIARQINNDPQHWLQGRSVKDMRPTFELITHNSGRVLVTQHRSPDCIDPPSKGSRKSRVWRTASKRLIAGKQPMTCSDKSKSVVRQEN